MYPTRHINYLNPFYVLDGATFKIEFSGAKGVIGLQLDNNDSKRKVLL